MFYPAMVHMDHVDPILIHIEPIMDPDWSRHESLWALLFYEYQCKPYSMGTVMLIKNKQTKKGRKSNY